MTMTKLATISAALCSTFFLTACPSDSASTGSDTGSSSGGADDNNTTQTSLTTTQGADTSSGPGGSTSEGGSTTASDASATTAADESTGASTGVASTTDASTGVASTGEVSTAGSTGVASTGGGSTGGGSTGAGSTTGGPAATGYGDCANNTQDVACTPLEQCVTDGTGNAVCLQQDCADASECPVPETGDATVTCVDVTGDMINDCYLSCQAGETCPDGMTCVLGFVCIWELQTMMGGGECPDVDLGSTVPQVVPGDATGLFDDYVSTCGDGGGEDQMFQFTAPSDGTYIFTTENSGVDTIISVLDGCGGTELDCNDDLGPGIFTSEVAIDLLADQSVIIVVDGYGGDVGPFDLNIHQ